MEYHEKNYPKGIELPLDLYGFAGVRAYPVSASEAVKIAKQFDIELPEPEGNGEYFYFNVNHGENHELMFGLFQSAYERAAALVGPRYDNPTSQRYMRKHDEIDEDVKFTLEGEVYVTEGYDTPEEDSTYVRARFAGTPRRRDRANSVRFPEPVVREAIYRSRSRSAVSRGDSGKDEVKTR